MSDVWLTDASDLGKVADASAKTQVESALAAAEAGREARGKYVIQKDVANDFILDRMRS